jgi:hypothetical protein
MIAHTCVIATLSAVLFAGHPTSGVTEGEGSRPIILAVMLQSRQAKACYDLRTGKRLPDNTPCGDSRYCRQGTCCFPDQTNPSYCQPPPR